MRKKSWGSQLGFCAHCLAFLPEAGNEKQASLGASLTNGAPGWPGQEVF